MLAKAEMKLPDEFLIKLSRLGDRADEICEKVLEAGAEVVEKNVRSNLRTVIGSGVKAPSRSTGELLSALGVSPVLQGKDGTLNIKIGFSEPRRVQTAAKGKRSYKESTNAMIANVLEYGRHGQPAKPFLKPAKTRSKKACLSAMEQAFEEEVKKI